MAGMYLTLQSLVGPTEVVGLSGRALEGARNLCATERPIIQQSAVPASKRHALRRALVDYVHAELGQPIDVCFA